MKRKSKWLIASIACIVAVGWWYVFASMEKAKSYSWENPPFGDSYSIDRPPGTWEEAKPLLKYMPPLPPNVEGLLLGDDGTFVPRSYFDVPPAIRFAMPVKRNYMGPAE